MGENDRELLELAAKAAGVVGEFQHFGIYVSPERTADNNCYWNPLQSDGDALRLAVKLQIDIFFDLPAITVFGPRVQITGDADNDPQAATRRAIVRAAAAIGKEMP